MNSIKKYQISDKKPLELVFSVHYKSGSHDHSRSGQKVDLLKDAHGREYSLWDIKKGELTGVTIAKKSSHMGKFETSEVTLNFDSSLTSNITILGKNIDEYHPDYYGELRQFGEEDMKPTINNSDFQVVVKSTNNQ